MHVAYTCFNKDSETRKLRGSLVSLLLALGNVSIFENVKMMLEVMLDGFSKSSTNRLEKSNRVDAVDKLIDVTYSRTFGTVTRMGAQYLFESYVRTNLVFEILGDLFNCLTIPFSPQFWRLSCFHQVQIQFQMSNF